jgi:predicted Rossmann fold flavoprotein
VENVFDFLSIGGGAAGFFGAIACAESNPGSRVAILEKSRTVLEKVRISGGGRCNVTHACFEPKELATRYPRGKKSLIGPFHRWATGDTVDWFEARGVELKTEADGRIFPVSDDSETIVACLCEAAERAGVDVMTESAVESISPGDGGWMVRLENGTALVSRAVLLATGGIRSGGGVRLAGDLGHTLIPAAPSLFTFRIRDPRIADLSGISVGDVRASIPAIGLEERGPCLITHWGLSGPAILKLSAWGARELAERDYRFEVVIDWTGGQTGEELNRLLQSARETAPKKRIHSGAVSLTIPSRLWQRLAEAAGIEKDATWSNLAKGERARFADQLGNCRFQVDGKSMNKEEFVTAGGVSLREVDFRTMESRIHPGLYFAGEVLDIDGVTGGFNFQSAWTTAYIAGQSAAERGAGSVK